MSDDLDETAYRGLWCPCGTKYDFEGYCPRCEPAASWAEIEAFADRQEGRPQAVIRSLHQDKVWTDREGTRHSVEFMPEQYIRNLLAFIERRAGDFYVARVQHHAQADVTGDQAVAAHERELEDLLATTPSQYVASTELVKALRARLVVLERQVIAQARS